MIRCSNESSRADKIRKLGQSTFGINSIVLILIGLVGFTTAKITEGATNSDSKIQDIFQNIKKQTSEKSYDLQVARATLDQKSAQAYTTWSRWIPRLDFQLSRTRSRDFSIIASGSLGSFAPLFNPQAVTLSQWYLSLTAPIYQRTIHVGILQASAEKEIAEHQLNSRLTELDWKLRSYLGNYLFQQYRNATLDTSIRLAEAGLREAKLRFTLGKNTLIDVLRAQTNLANFQSEKISQEQQIITAFGNLQEYTGLSESDLNESGLKEIIAKEEPLALAIDDFASTEHLLKWLQPFLESSSVATLPASQIESQIAHYSPGFKNAVLNENLAHSQAQNITAREWPELKLQASLTRQYNEINPIYNPEHPSYSVALVLTVPLFSGGSLWSNLSEQFASNRANRIRAEKEKIHLKNEIEREITSLRTSLKTIEAKKLALQQNEEIVRLSFKSYELGKTTIVELLGSQQDLIRAKTELAKTKIDISVLIRQLAWNLGVQSQ